MAPDLVKTEALRLDRTLHVLLQLRVHMSRFVLDGSGGLLLGGSAGAPRYRRVGRRPVHGDPLGLGVRRHPRRGLSLLAWLAGPRAPARLLRDPGFRGSDPPRSTAPATGPGPDRH